MSGEVDFDLLVLAAAIEHWNREYTGVSSQLIASRLQVENDSVLDAFKRLESRGNGKSQGNIFFPSQQILDDIYYSSDLPRKNTPEYKARLHRGGNQVELFYFGIGVLAKYFAQPELYRVEDSLSGGKISVGDDERITVSYLSVRYGKRILSDGDTAIAAILKDLSCMGDDEQRYWHSFELSNPQFRSFDREFYAFISRTYAGVWIDTSNPLQRISQLLESINSSCTYGSLFTRTENPHLSIPVLNTRKSFCSSCQELFKLVGPDSISLKNLKKLMVTDYGFEETSFVNSDSGRPKSGLMLLLSLESSFSDSIGLVEKIDEIRSFRVEGAHKIASVNYESDNYVERFIKLASDLATSLQNFLTALESKRRPAI